MKLFHSRTGKQHMFGAKFNKKNISIKLSPLFFQPWRFSDPPQKSNKYQQKKSKQFHRPFSAVFIKILAVLIIITITIFGLFELLLTPLVPYGKRQDTIKWIEKEQIGLSKVFNDIFVQAEKCTAYTSCQQAVAAEIYNVLPGLKKLKDFSSTYFIRLSEDRKYILKLFLSGEFKKTIILTTKEKDVRDLLTGSKDILIGIRIPEIYTNMIWLKDFPSEAEIILPVKDSVTTIGAVVRLYGD